MSPFHATKYNRLAEGDVTYDTHIQKLHDTTLQLLSYEEMLTCAWINDFMCFNCALFF